MPVRPRRWLLLAAASLVSVPLLIWFGGGLLAGPYEGDGGLFGLLGALYGDLLRGRGGAVLLLFGPVLLVAIWALAIALRRRIGGAPAVGQGQ